MLFRRILLLRESTDSRGRETMIGNILRNRVWQVVIAAGLGLAIVGGVFAYTASNTVPGSQAGEGQGTVTGYVLTSVHYGLNATDSTKIDSVTFNLDSPPGAGSTIKAKPVSTGSWYTCTVVGVAVTCPTTSPQVTVNSADTLNVVAAQ